MPPLPIAPSTPTSNKGGGLQTPEKKKKRRQSTSAAKTTGEPKTKTLSPAELKKQILQDLDDMDQLPPTRNVEAAAPTSAVPLGKVTAIFKF